MLKLKLKSSSEWNGYEHLYFTAEGVEYRDFTMYVNSYIAPDGQPKDDRVTLLVEDGSKAEEMLKDPGKALAGVPVPKGSSLYLVPDCRYSHDDVRKNYTLKRTVDTGDYNVFSPASWSHYYNFNRLCAFPELKVAFLANIGNYYSRTSFDEDMRKYSSKHGNADSVSKNFKYLSTYKVNPAWKSLLDGTLVKPCVAVSSLDLAHGDPPGLDALMLLYRTGAKDDINDSKPDQEFLMQLNAVNNTDWRSRPFSVYTALWLAEGARYGGHKSVSGRALGAPSLYPKAVHGILQTRPPKPSCEEDFLLARQLTDSVLDIGGTRVATLSDYKVRLETAHLRSYMIEDLFRVDVRIKPVSWEEYMKKAESRS